MGFIEGHRNTVLVNENSRGGLSSIKRRHGISFFSTADVFVPNQLVKGAIAIAFGLSGTLSGELTYANAEAEMSFSSQGTLTGTTEPYIMPEDSQKIKGETNVHFYNWANPSQYRMLAGEAWMVFDCASLVHCLIPGEVAITFSSSATLKANPLIGTIPVLFSEQATLTGIQGSVIIPISGIATLIFNSPGRLYFTTFQGQSIIAFDPTGRLINNMMFASSEWSTSTSAIVSGGHTVISSADGVSLVVADIWGLGYMTTLANCNSNTSSGVIGGYPATGSSICSSDVQGSFNPSRNISGEAVFLSDVLGLITGIGYMNSYLTPSSVTSSTLSGGFGLSGTGQCSSNTIGLLSGIGYMVAAATGGSNSQGAFDPLRNIGSNNVCSSNVLGSLIASGYPVSVADCSSNVLGTLIAKGYMNVQILCSSDVRATTNSIQNLDVDCICSSLTACTIWGIGYMTVQAACSSNVNAQLYPYRNISGQADGVSLTAGSLLALGTISGTAGCSSVTVAALVGKGTISGQADGVSTTVGLVLNNRLSGGITASSSTGGTMTGKGYLNRVVFTDDFDSYENGALLTVSNYWKFERGTFTVYKPSSDGEACGASAGNCSAYYNWDYTNDQFAQAVYSAASNVDTIGVSVRNYGLGGNANCYMLYAYTGSYNGHSWWLDKLVNGVVTEIGYYNTPIVQGDVIRLEVIGSNLKGYRNGIVIIDITDTSLTYGKPGLSAYNSGTAYRVDDWIGGNSTYNKIDCSSLTACTGQVIAQTISGSATCSTVTAATLGMVGTLGEIANNISKTNLIDYWKLDESSGNAVGAHAGKSGTVATVTQGATGKINTGYTFASGTGGVSFGDDSSFDFGTSQDFSVSCWIRTTNVADTHFISKIYTGQVPGWLVGVDVDGTCYMLIRDGVGSGDTDYRYVNSTGAITTGNWVHVVATYDRDGYGRLYIDGTENASVPINTVTDTINNTNAFMFGRRDYSGSPMALTGTLDEIAVFNKVLSAFEVKGLYGASNGFAYPLNTCIASSSTVANLTQASSGNNITGSAACSSNVVATLVARGYVSGSATGVTTTVGSFMGQSPIYGNVICSSNVLGATQNIRQISGNTTGITATVGVIGAKAYKVGSATCSSTTAGTVGSQAISYITGSATGVTTTTGVRTAKAYKVGSAICSSTTAGAGTRRRNITGTAACSSVTSSNITAKEQWIVISRNNASRTRITLYSQYNTSVSLSGSGLWYTAATGGTGGSSWTVILGAERTMYLELSSGTCTMTFSDPTAILHWGYGSTTGILSTTNSPRLVGGGFSMFTSLTDLRWGDDLGGQVNTTINDLPSTLVNFEVGATVRVDGGVSFLPTNLEMFSIYYGTITGDWVNLPQTLKTIYLYLPDGTASGDLL